MSISPVGGVGAVPVHPPATAAKSEGRQAPAAIDRDGDSDNSAAAAPSTPRGSVNVKA
jgi:hypothetical protein